MHAADPERATRPEATVTPALLNEMSRAFVRTAVLRTAVALRIFDALVDGPCPVEKVAAGVGASPRGTRILLDSLAALGLVDRTPEGYLPASGAETLLVSSSPGYVGGNLRVAASDWEWEALGRLAEAVRAGGTVLAANADTPNFAFWEDFATYATPFTARGAELVADAVAPWAAGRDGLSVLDVACGHGQYGFAVASRLPASRLTCLDWPAVLAVTRENAARAGLADRVEYRSGDMFTTEPGGPYDVIVISNVLHHFAEPRAGALLARLADVLRPGGRLVVVGFTVDEDVPAVVDPRPHLFSLHMLSLTPEGETHSAQTYRRMLTAAGLGRVETVTTAGQPLTVLIGTAP